MSDMSDFEQWFSKECPTYRDGPFTGAIKSQLRNAFEACQAAKQSMRGEAKFSASDDADRLRSVARGMSYNDMSEATWKHVILEIAMRLDTGGYSTHAPDSAARIAELEQQLEVARNQPRLTVKVASFPESNGKRNWTALLVRSEPWEGLIGNCGGITVARGELWNRVAYEAERTRYLIGERDTEPHIFDYGDDIATPEQWSGEVRGSKQNIDAAINIKGGAE